jgi:ABC-type transport system involved in multi-copper enzyme maturation permease subunit
MTAGIILLLIQYAAAVPWLLAITWRSVPPRDKVSTATVKGWPLHLVLGAGLAGAVVLGLVFGFLMENTGDRETLESFGRWYAWILQLQLYADLIVVILALAMWLWPKGGAVARAAFREGYRQPLFWMLLGLASGMLFISPFVPYFTFGEDFIMVKELGFDIVILAGGIFGVLAAQSITEEIEGRTAITLMSKPVSRRQFLLGKFLGIFLCALMMVLIVGYLFDLVLLYKRWFDRMDPIVLAPDVTAWIERLGWSSKGQQVLRGIALWAQHSSETVPGLVMSATLVMVLTAIAVTLAVRTPMIVNLTTCLFVYIVANLMPIIVQLTRTKDSSNPTAVQKLLQFTAQLFDSLLPNLELFRIRPTLLDENALPLRDYVQHVAAVGVYGLLFTAIVLLLGLVLFEDRDLA